MRRFVSVLGFVGAVGCAHGNTTTQVGSDTFRVRCPELPLDQCLGQTADNACDKRAYFVVRGVSDVNLRGRSEAPDAVRSSEAVVRCATGNSWGDEAKQLMNGEPAAAAATTSSAPKAPAPAPTIPTAPATVCAPGSTQACIGSAGCHGGQACKADGSGYEPCDCGPPASAPAAPQPSQPAP